MLRDDWGFDGFVVTDWFAARSTVAMANARLSLEMPGAGRHYGPALLAAVEAGDVPAAALDAIAGDLLGVMERTGALDGDGDFTETTLDRPADRTLIRRAAAAASVLLRNDGTLPLDPATLSTVAVIGPNAYNAKVMGGGSAKVNAYRATSPLDALAARLPDAAVRWEPGSDIDRTTPALTRPLVEAGVTIDYFDGQDLAGEPVHSVTSPALETTAFGAPAPGVSATAYSLRARATVVPTVSGPHELRLIQSGRARVSSTGSW
ncbi:MAG: glycoside hydrolase family 3 C-terminal domain-containing protein [Acidimicrobiales bacterium]